MSNYIIDIPENYYISEYSHHWMVQISIDKKPKTKNFSFRKYGSKKEALKKAISYRDKLVKDNNIDLKKRFKKSKIPGINRTIATRRNGVKVAYWQAIWTENGKQRTKRFSTKTYGENEAKELAIKHREKIIKLLDDSGQTLFEKPDANTKIWRYMDFTKFVYMLEKGGLFFPNVECFKDPYEGSYSRGNFKMRSFVFSRAKGENKLQEQIEEIKELRPFININCWHMNDFESAGMWKLYSQTNESICIQTTFGKLEKSLPESIKFGKVKYINYDKDWIPESDNYYPFIYKRLSFEHERELRAIFDSSEENFEKTFEKTENGYWINLNLITLVQKIYVSPEADDWFVELVEKVKNKYNLNYKKVYKSPLNNEPNLNKIKTGHNIV
tara:strand:+ start:60 stop:1214 length:1155 start_codon:yes stop_codon:yes gene_type:complete